MRPRILMGKALIRLGDFTRSLAVAVMRPDDLTALARASYAHPESVANWSAPETLARGLSREEQALLDDLPVRQGRLLLLGVGGGREAIPFARQGFAVTGVDFIPAMVERAIANADRAGVRIEGLVQDLAAPRLPAGAFDVAWLSAGMYSCVPTRRRRLALLRAVRVALKPEGVFACQFCVAARPSRRAADRLRKLAAWLTLGNLGIEPGDRLWGNQEFLHEFPSADMLRIEFAAGGFDTVRLHLPAGAARGGAILRRSA